MSHSSFSFLISAILFLTLLSPTIAQPNYRAHSCTLSNNYTTTSPFPTNLNTTLSLLYNTTNTHGFSNATFGSGADAAHSLFLCRGDVSHQLCDRCVRASAETLLARCPNQKEAIVWFDECMVRYANRSIGSVREETPKFYLWNRNNNTDPVRFNENVGGLMSRLVGEAVSATNFYATADANGTSVFERLYGLVQCTPHISAADCELCLSGCVGDIPECCYGMRGGRVMKPSCSIRYESYPFYESIAAPPPASLSPSPAPPLVPVSANATEPEKMSTKATIGISVGSTIAFTAIASILCYCFVSRTCKKNDLATIDGNGITSVKSLQMDLDKIKAATNNFSDENKIGQGGFGSVYKGTFPEGQDIAVKRLSKRSSQGSEEFKNELILLTRLEHRNLARLIGFSLQGGEKLLVYEFVPNKSLDYFLFDQEKRGLLDWSRRYKIIGGVARGLLYLHVDSRLRIIHRDLKPSNVLLDMNMVPKISDFGMAKIFGVDQTQGNTSRIAGTYGYISPEYARNGQFSVKSDVYSFGVLVLEIVTGKKISTFDQEAGDTDNLLSFAWRHWSNGTAMELVDPILGNSYSREEVIKCVHIGLLSTQENPAERPTMDTVALMLSSSSVTMPLPHQPAFFVHTTEATRQTNYQLELHRSQNDKTSLSENELSITELYPR